MKKQTDAKTLWTLFKSMFVLSACTFGGGFVIVSLMKKKFVEELQWLDESEMLDITAITQSSPGPLPVNASVIIGYRMGGILGSLTAILGTIIPPMLIISVISLFYTEFRTNTYIASVNLHRHRPSGDESRSCGGYHGRSLESGVQRM